MSQTQNGGVHPQPDPAETLDERLAMIEGWAKDVDARQIAATAAFTEAVEVRDAQHATTTETLTKVLARIGGAEQAISSASQAEYKRVAALADGFVAIDGRMCGFEMAMKAGFDTVTAQIKALAGRLNEDELDTYEKNLALGLELGLHKRELQTADAMREKHESIQDSTLSEIDKRIIDHAIQLADSRTRHQKVDDFLAKHFPTAGGRWAAGLLAAGPVVKILWDLWSKLHS